MARLDTVCEIALAVIVLLFLAVTISCFTVEQSKLQSPSPIEEQDAVLEILKQALPPKSVTISSGVPDFPYDQYGATLLRQLGAQPEDFARCIQLQQATGRQIEPMALRSALDGKPLAVELMKEHLAKRVFK